MCCTYLQTGLYLVSSDRAYHDLQPFELNEEFASTLPPAALPLQWEGCLRHHRGQSSLTFLVNGGRLSLHHHQDLNTVRCTRVVILRRHLALKLHYDSSVNRLSKLSNNSSIFCGSETNVPRSSRKVRSRSPLNDSQLKLVGTANLVSEIRTLA